MSEISPIRPMGRIIPPAVLDPIDAGTPSPSAPQAKSAQTLNPAVAVAIGTEGKADRRETDYTTKFVKDLQARQIVYQVVDPLSGDVVVQLPTATALKARIYAEASASQSQVRSATVQMHVDKVS